MSVRLPPAPADRAGKEGPHGQERPASDREETSPDSTGDAQALCATLGPVPGEGGEEPQ